MVCYNIKKHQNVTFNIDDSLVCEYEKIKIFEYEVVCGKYGFKEVCAQVNS